MRSDIMKKGKERAAHRSLLAALGLTKKEIERPLIGVVNSANEIVPGHIHLGKIAEAVKSGKNQVNHRYGGRIVFYGYGAPL